jgi:hypothetical protein
MQTLLRQVRLPVFQNKNCPAYQAALKRCFLWGLQNQEVLNKSCISMQLFFYMIFLLVTTGKLVSKNACGYSAVSVFFGKLEARFDIL